MICLEVSGVSDDRVQDALARLAADQEGSLPGLLGFLWTHASSGEISGRLEVEKQHLAPTGFLHAATVVALADTACGYGCLQSLPEGATGFATAELNANNELAFTSEITNSWSSASFRATGGGFREVAMRHQYNGLTG